MKTEIRRILKRLLLAILIFVMPISVTGCWDGREIDTIAIVTGVGIDTAENQDEISLTAFIANTQQSQSQQNDAQNSSSPGVVMKSTGKGTISAIEMLKNKNSRIPFFHHNQVVIFGKEQAEKGILPYLDVFLRYYEMRKEVYVLIADGKAEEILSAKTNPELSMAKSLLDILDNRKRTSSMLSIKIIDITSQLLDTDSSVVIPMVRVEENDEVTAPVIKDMAILKKGKMEGLLSGDQVYGYLWLTGDIKDRYLEVDTENGYANLHLFNLKCKVEPVIDKNGMLSVNLTITGQMITEELIGFYSMELKQVVELLQKESANVVRREIEASLSKAKELDADIYRMGAAFHRKYPKQWKKLSGDWEQLFLDVSVNADVTLKIINTQEIADSLQMEGIQ